MAACFTSASTILRDDFQIESSDTPVHVCRPGCYPDNQPVSADKYIASGWKRQQRYMCTCVLDQQNRKQSKNTDQTLSQGQNANRAAAHAHMHV